MIIPTEPYIFDWKRIEHRDPYHIEYCITDLCNRSCARCSHLAPLVKKPFFVSEDEFERVAKILQKVIPDTHAIWLTGGEPALHPKFRQLLEIACGIFKDSYIGIYTNGLILDKYENDRTFWDFTRNNGILWGVTGYEKGEAYYEQIFIKHNCRNNFTYLQDGLVFFHLISYSHGQPVTREKYDNCGWEKSKIFVRDGKIFACPSAEFAYLFNNYFGESVTVTEHDYIIVDEHLTRERLEAFRGPVPLCSQCDYSRRYKNFYPNIPSAKTADEWSVIDNGGK